MKKRPTKNNKNLIKEGVIFVIESHSLIKLEKRIEKDSEYFGYILIPGGGMEAGETDEHALIREVKEEFNVKICKFRKIGKINHFNDSGEPHIKHVFVVTKWKGVLSNPEGINEQLDASLEEARKLCSHPLSQLILDLYEKHLSADQF